jgi:acyl-CoA thioesterase-1
MQMEKSMKRKMFVMTRAALLALAALVSSGLMSVPGTANAETIQIVAIGDSNIAGKGVSSSEAYPAKLERALLAKGYDARVTNAGINGDTSAGLLSRLNADVPQGTRVAIVWVGINDLRKGVPAAQVEANRQQAAARLRARGIKVLLLGPRHGLVGQPKYLIGDQQQHLNPAGYDVIVARTVGRVQALLGGRH